MIGVDPIAVVPISTFGEEEIIVVGDLVYPMLTIMEKQNAFVEFERISQETELQRFNYITGFEEEL